MSESEPETRIEPTPEAAGRTPVTARRYRDGGGYDVVDESTARELMASAPPSEGGFLWIGLVDPPASELEALRVQLGLHTLAIRDAENGRQQPKVQWFGGELFIVLWALHPQESRTDTAVSEVYLFAREGVLISVERSHHGSRLDAGAALDQALPATLGMGSLGGVHAIVSRAVQGYLDVGSSIEQELEDLEHQVFDEDQRDDARRIYGLRRQIGKVDRAVSALATAFEGSRDALEDYAKRNPALVPYVLDLILDLDAAARLTVGQDAALSSVIATHENAVASQQNIDSRKISAIAAILAIPAVVSGLYGMNIPGPPGTNLQYGWILIIVAMVALEVWAYIALKRRKWL